MTAWLESPQADWCLEGLSDPEKDADDYMPTPYTDLPAFIRGAGEVMDLCPPPDIADRLTRAVALANEMLRAMETR